MSPKRNKNPLENQHTLDSFATPSSTSQSGDIRGLQDQMATVITALTGIQQTLTSMTEKMDDHANRLAGLQQAMDTLKPKVTDHAGRLQALETVVPAVQASTAGMERGMDVLQARLEELEGRSRRNNVRVIGLPESFDRAAHPDLAAGVESLLRGLFGAESFSAHLVVERAHRLAGGFPRPGAPPRPFLFRVLNFRDTDTILRLARARAPIQYENGTISFYPDYTREVQRRRKAYDVIRETLRANEVKYVTLFPARFRIIWQDQAHVFDSPTAAADFVQRIMGMQLVHDLDGDVDGAAGGWRRPRGRRRRGGRGREDPVPPPREVEVAALVVEAQPLPQLEEQD